MKNIMGIIDDRKRPEGLEGLINKRSPGAIPFGSKYRMVDLLLSSMSESGIKNVGIFTGKYSGSLMNHVKSGKEWGLLRLKDGLFMLPSEYRDHIDYLDRSKEEYVLYSSNNIVYFSSYEPMEQFLKEKNADIVIAYAMDKKPPMTKGLYLEIQGDLVSGLSKEQTTPDSRRTMEVLLMKKEIFKELLEGVGQIGSNPIDVLIKEHEKYKIHGYSYKGYVAYVDDLLSFYKENLALVEEKRWMDLFQGSGSISTIPNDEAPTKYLEASNVKKTLVTEGCIIKGDIENSMIFRGVKVKAGAKIKNSIIMQKALIGRNAVIENAILDKDVEIRAGVKIIGTPEKPLFISKKSIVEKGN
ncbi:glucose-1-phosphate adenylyltransferase subunit GlgD [Isachenkonia alkalipeptolytica]|uniref:Glucose-1-phosphate adenylyltransferase subunit GlgD n=1 Tax=Isachenkonia alkalipeptolytica TaxID=2565777 RepID=A0AA43XIM7_9CLOT|nr:glucose-1-phosphate adenylyltransferase subunit GlgD [Isachenkonia alkalipeptolytica]NBG86889.1 glucose-1-phosphate adenylyltransferase subunit GlgD [Isachenkonia alkalipeptolytica]